MTIRDLLIHFRGKEATEHLSGWAGGPLPFAVLFAAGRAAGGPCAIPVAFGVPAALPPTARGHAFRRAGPLDGTRSDM